MPLLCLLPNHWERATSPPRRPRHAQRNVALSILPSVLEGTALGLAQAFRINFVLCVAESEHSPVLNQPITSHKVANLSRKDKEGLYASFSHFLWVSSNLH